MAVDTVTRPLNRSLLDRSFDVTRVNWEVVGYLAIVILSVIAHLWGLGTMAMHHDESIHAWSSWRFFKGEGGFTCYGGRVSPTYCYDPVYHGPSLYVLTLIAYFLFGDGEAQARLPMALAGIGMVASSWWLRPYLGRRGALVAALLLGFSPSLLYYTRFARHDGLMVLWETWMVIGFFRFLDSGKARWLYLVSVGLALAIATHELYYILLFIFGIFVLMRLLAESRFASRLNLGLLIVVGLCLVLMIINPQLPIGKGLYLGEKAFLIGSALLLSWLCQRVWEPQPILTTRLIALWREDRSSLWVALGLLGGLYLVFYTTFFSYPRGALDGLYAGIAYWLGSQQEFARGDQPWYYYLIQLPLYEPLGVILGLSTVVYLMTMATRRAFMIRRDAKAAVSVAQEVAEEAGESEEDGSKGKKGQRKAGKSEQKELIPTRTQAPTVHTSDMISAMTLPKDFHTVELFPLLLTFWYFSAVIIFSWAGEKMPWLVVHMALPGNLLAAWVIGRLLRIADLRDAHGEPKPGGYTLQLALLIPALVVVLLIALGVAWWRIGTPTDGQAGQSSLLQGIIPLLLAGGIIYTLLTLAQKMSARIVLALAGLVVAVGLSGYMLRATWMAVYKNPDVAVELMVYTQTAPDVPRYVQAIHELAINLMRNQRTAEDSVGELGMPLIVDSGDDKSDGDGSLAWPLQWYLRDFQRVNWRTASTFRDNPTAQSFEVPLPDGSTGLAPVVLLYKPHVTDKVREVLQANYVQPYGAAGVFNWWFPEGDKCSPKNAGYKRFYFNTWTSAAQLKAEPGSSRAGCGRDISAEVESPFAPLLWPFRPANWDTLKNFVLYRELPTPLTPGSRDMEVWIRNDLAGSAGTAAGAAPATAASSIRLVARQVITSPEPFNGPTGIAVDSKGTIYVADTQNHRIKVFDAQGSFIRSFGGKGSGAQEFFEPRGVAVDAQDNLYVADTWNARITKFSPTGQWLKSWGSGDKDLGEGRKATLTGATKEANAATPLGFFGPRGLVIDHAGKVYIADTGNKRIVVTDTEGNFLFQWGYGGSEPGAFNEPTGVGIDDAGNIYVADTWNGRVQVFPREGDRVAELPSITWRVSGWKPNTYDDPSLTASPDGRVFVSVPAQQAVLGANGRGDILLRWGGAGDDAASLNTPSGMVIAPDGTILVVDRTTGRLLRFVLPDIRS